MKHPKGFVRDHVDRQQSVLPAISKKAAKAASGWPEDLGRQNFPRLRRSALRHLNCSGVILSGSTAALRAPGDSLNNSCGQRRRLPAPLRSSQSTFCAYKLSRPRLSDRADRLCRQPEGLATAPVRQQLRGPFDLAALAPRWLVVASRGRCLALLQCPLAFVLLDLCDKTAASVFQLLILEELLLRPRGRTLRACQSTFAEAAANNHPAPPVARRPEVRSIIRAFSVAISAADCSRCCAVPARLAGVIALPVASFSSFGSA